MEFIDKSLSTDEISKLQKAYGNYVKLTIDIGNRWVMVGCELHADGEKVLLEKGSKQDNIWGGGIDFDSKQIDTTAVLNLRPRLNNDSLEIMNSEIREKFIQIVRDYCKELWL